MTSQEPITFKRILAVDPCHKGFGYVIMDDSLSLLAWGIKCVNPANKNTECLSKIDDLIRVYRPEVFVLEALGEASRRGRRIRHLLKRLLALTIRKRIKTRSFTRAEVKAVFAGDGAITKQDIAAGIARDFPELLSHMPRNRKCSDSEDYRMDIFDALALALTFLADTAAATQ